MSRMIPTLALLLVMLSGAFAHADKPEIKSLGFDYNFTPHPMYNPDITEVFEGDTLRIVLHQNAVFGKDGLKIPPKHLLNDELSYFVYPGNRCTEDCLSTKYMSTPADIAPFSHTYYVLGPAIPGKNVRVMLFKKARVVGEDLLARAKSKSKKKKGALPAPKPPPPTPPAGEDPEHPTVHAIPLDEPGGEEEPVHEAVPVYSPPAPGLATPSGYLPSLLEKYVERCSGDEHKLSYTVYYIDPSGVLQEEKLELTIPAYSGSGLHSQTQAREWLAEILEAQGNDFVTFRFHDRIIIEARESEDFYVTSIEVKPSKEKCESNYLGFLRQRENVFPFTEKVPQYYPKPDLQSYVCIPDEHLTEMVRSDLSSSEQRIYKCAFEEPANLGDYFWAFFTYQPKGKKKKVIKVSGDPLLVSSTKEEIVNVEARISYEGSPEESESFHHPTLDEPVYQLVVKKAKPGVYAITPVITYEGDEGRQTKPGAVIFIKVRPREDYSRIRLQMGIISYNELRAMAFTVMMTPVLNKNFFRRKFFPAPYPMPHIGLRLGSQDAGGIIGLQVGFGIALLKEFIIVGGLQFGTADLTTPWDWRKSWYVGVAIDPWLLQKGMSKNKEED
jgi:hypothetical protein